MKALRTEAKMRTPRMLLLLTSAALATAGCGGSKAESAQSAATEGGIAIKRKDGTSVNVEAHNKWKAGVAAFNVAEKQGGMHFASLVPEFSGEYDESLCVRLGLIVAANPIRDRAEAPHGFDLGRTVSRFLRELMRALVALLRGFVLP